MDPVAKPAWMRHQALQSCVCHQLRHLESPSAFAEICQATIHLGLRSSFGARGSARWWCEPGMSPDVRHENHLDFRWMAGVVSIP